MKRLIKKSEWLDIYNRDAAVAYINGLVFSAETHAECVGMYLDEIDSNKDLESYKYRPSESQLEEVDVDKFAFAHLLEKNKAIDNASLIVLQAGIYIESGTLINVTMDEVKNAIKQTFPQYNVYEYDEDITSSEDVEKIAKMLRGKRRS